jgi:hypothetical protein
VSRALAFALVSWLTRLAVGLALAAIVATLLSLLIEDRSWVESLGIALVTVGSITLLLAFGGHSPALRRGIQPAYLASMFPGLAVGPGTRTRRRGSATRRSSSRRARRFS